MLKSTGSQRSTTFLKDDESYVIRLANIRKLDNVASGRWGTVTLMYYWRGTDSHSHSVQQPWLINFVGTPYGPAVPLP